MDMKNLDVHEDEVVDWRGWRRKILVDDYTALSFWFMYPTPFMGLKSRLIDWIRSKFNLKSKVTDVAAFRGLCFDRHTCKW